MTVSIKIKNEAKILRAFALAPAETAKAMTIAMRKIAVFVAGETKRHITSGTNMWKSPIKTGALRRGIQAQEFEPMKATIRPSTATPYATFVHEGTQFMEARPFFQITAEASSDKIAEFMNQEIETALNKTL